MGCPPVRTITMMLLNTTQADAMQERPPFSATEI